MAKAIFLHHSTGNNIWLGGVNKLMNKVTGKNSVQKEVSISRMNTQKEKVIHIRTAVFQKGFLHYSHN